MRVRLNAPLTVRWVPAKTWAEIHGLHPQTLANWRQKDKIEGRNDARPGFPVYRRWGTAVRYLLPEQPEGTA